MMDQPFRALTSASNFYRRKLCPGSEQAEMGLPDLVIPNPARDEGEMLHRMESDPEEDREVLRSHQIRALEKNQRRTDAYIAETFKRLAEEVDPKFAHPGSPTIWKEREYFLCDDKGDPITPPIPGHTDLVVWYPKVKVVFVRDSKFGRYPVMNAELNYQLRCYAVMLHDELAYDRCYAFISQPYLQEPLDFHDVEYLGADVPEWRKELMEVLAECKKPDAKRCPCIEACGFCRAQGTDRCHESVHAVREVRRLKVLELKPHKLEEWGQDMLLASRIIEAWGLRIRYVLEHYPQLLKKYELAPQQYLSSIPEPVKAFERLYEQGFFGEGVTREAAMEQFVTICCKASPSKLADHAQETRNLSENDAETLVAHMLGHNGFYEDKVDPDPNCLLVAKPKKRSIRLKPSATRTQEWAS